MAKRRAVRKRYEAPAKVTAQIRQAPDVTPLSDAAPDGFAIEAVVSEAMHYGLDLWQRHLLFLDTLRERANNMLAHEQSGLPPVLSFDYESVLDARRFERPVSYALLRITGAQDKCAEDCVKEGNRPVIVIDPRAGHGPGIGGFKRDSEVGIAMHEATPCISWVSSLNPVPARR